MQALPSHLLGRLAEWERLDELEQEITTADVRRIAALLERGR
jgi:hypothetical protein